MAGPSLQLGVSAAGQDTLVGLNEQLALLRTNLSALKSAKVDLSSLSSAQAELKKLRQEFSENGAALRTSFAELAEAIKGGFTKTAEATEQGGRKARSAVVAERQLLQAEYEKATADGYRFTQAEIARIKAAGVQLSVAHKQALEAQRGIIANNRVFSQGVSVSNALPKPPPSNAPESEISAAYSQHEAQMAAEAAQLRARTWIKAQAEADAEIERARLQGFRGFAAMEKKLAEQRVAVALETAKLEAGGIAQANQIAFSANGLRSQRISTARTNNEQAPLFAAAADADFQRAADAVAKAKEEAWAKASLRTNASLAQIEEERLRGFTAIEKEAAARQLAVQKESEAALAKGMAQNDAFVKAEAERAAKDVAAIKRAADQRIAAMKEAEARYLAATPRAAAGTLVQARAQLDQGIAPIQVAQKFGTSAADAAAAASGLEALKLAHINAGNAAVDHIPKVNGLNTAIRDLQSTTRGLAQGFGQSISMFSSLGPLLAGAALTGAFAQTVKQGAEVAHELAIIKVLAEEDSAAVAGLNKQLLEMSSNGVFGPKELATAFKNLTLAGLTIKEQKTAIGDVTNFAIAGTTTIEHASEALVQISTAFGYTANGYGRVADVISKAAAISLSSVETLTRSMQSASEVHVLYGQSLVDVATNLAVLSQLGIRGTAAGTALKNMYAELSGSTSIVRRNIQAYNLELLDSNGKVKDLLPLMETLGEKYNSLKGSAQTRFIQDLSNTRGGKDMASLFAEFNKTAASPENNPRLAQLAKETPEVVKLAAEYRKLGDQQKQMFTDSLTSKTGSAELSNRLVEYNKIYQDSVRKLSDTRRQIDESYGFAAIAAATLATTAKSQMATVSASFQTALVKAFDAVEPAVLSISAKLRGIFNSEGFQSAIQNLGVTVANIGIFLIEHVNLITKVAEAYLIWKVAVVSMSVLEGMIALASRAAVATSALAGAMGLSTAATTANTTATRSNALAAEADALAIEAEVMASRNSAIASEARAVATRSATVATEANTLATEANAVTAGTAARAATGLLGMLARSIPVIGGIAIAGSIAMDLFWNSAGGKKANVADSFDEKAKQVLEKLKSQTDLAKANWQSLAGIGDTKNAEAQIQGKQQLDDLENEVVKRGEAVAAAKRKLDEQNAALAQATRFRPAVETNAGGAAFVGPSIGRRAPTLTDPANAGEPLLKLAPGGVAQAKTEFDEAQRQYSNVLKLKNDTRGQLDQLVMYSKGIANLADENAKVKKGTGTGENPVRPSTGQASAELSSLTARYHSAEELAKKHYGQMQRLEDERHKYGLITDIEYELNTEKIAEASYAKQSEILDNFITASKNSLAALYADKKKNQAAIAVEEKQQNDLTKQRQELDFLKEQAKLKKEGTEFKQEQDISKFITQQMTSLAVSREQVTTQQALEKLSSDQRAIEEARIAAQAQFNDKLREQNLRLAEAQAYLDKQREDSGPGESGANIARAQQEVERLQGSIQRLRESASTAGQFAAETMVMKLKPQWQRLLEEWRNVTEQMKVAYDSIVDGFIAKGEEIFSRMVKTGKLTASELLDVIRDTLIKQVYQQTIAPVIAQVGQKVAEIIFGARPTASAAASPIDLASQNTTAALTTMTDAGVAPATNALAIFIDAVNHASNALFTSGGGGGGSGVGGLLGSIFGGGKSVGGNEAGGLQSGGFGSGYGYGNVDLGSFIGAAKGAAFANGGQFTDMIVSEPTPFRFGLGGANLGLMGEAGPEAIMPLKRGSDGSLGVQMHPAYYERPAANNGGGSNTYVIVENHGNNKAEVKESKRSNGDRETRVIIDAAKAAVVQSIHEGGEVGTAIESQYGVNRASGLPRR